MDAPQTPSQPAGALGGRAVAAADDRERLLALIRETAVVHGRVTLSSGAEADYYVDLRRVSLDHRVHGRLLALAEVQQALQLHFLPHSLLQSQIRLLG